jgi:protein-S-isoprenylcysteine O-methyltransferase Ste14
MSVGHLVLVVGLSTYLVVGLIFEERALLRIFGDAYADYQRRVPMLIPRLRAARE